jgi:hypothetical protein
MLVRFNVASSLLRGGRVTEAEDVVGTRLGVRFDADHWPLHIARAVIDVRRGLHQAARDRVDEIWAEPSTSARKDLEFLVWAADVAFWAGGSVPTLDHLVTPLDEVADTAPLRLFAPTLVAAARAAAELGARAASEPLQNLATRCGLLAPEHRDDRDLAAHRDALAAEQARLDGTHRLDQWAALAARWDDLGRRHDAAYCRWRAAQRALRDSQGTVAAKLLRKAAADTREHVPLSEAIAAIRSGAA